MRKFTFAICITLVLTVFTSCSKDSSDDSSVVGTWQLTTWTINVPIDLNNDAIASINLLDEANCTNNELLIFEANGTVSSNATYNPQVKVSLVNGTVDNYLFNVECDNEGTIGAAGNYTQNNNLITFFNKIATKNGNQLTIIYENAIDIYSEDLNSIVDTKDLILIYGKK